MSENWQAGDLALCICASGFDELKLGKIYQVIEVWIGRTYSSDGLYHPWDGLGLRFGIFGEGDLDSWNHLRFRKVTPPKADEFDREVIELMTDRKVPSHA